jgi:serine phosphatase RsbU (regulator of sigma subunit)
MGKMGEVVARAQSHFHRTLCWTRTLMSELHEKSVAFQQALLKSERLRILIVLGAIGAAFIVRTIRTIILHSRDDLHLWLLTFLLVALFFGYEYLILRAVNHAIRIGGGLANAAWISNIIVESCLPALAVAFLSSASIDPAYRPLANPAVLVFFLFIILSTLRLNPMACRASGLVAAVSYLVAAMYLGWKPSFGGGVSLLSPEKAVISYAVTLVVAGFVAGAVASEIRKQVDAALREAETRRQVERLEHDLEVARSIQQSLLPASMPQIEGFDIAAWNQPADQTGGDYYDWQPLPDGKVLVALGDVTGHGIGSALLAAVCRAYARANFTAENGLLIAMERINAALARDMIEGRFVTFVAAVCSPTSSHVEVLSAGHGPLFRYFLGEDRFDKMDAQGLPLGISSILSSEPPRTLDLNPGDLLVLATDGFFEWANAQGEQFGTERLEETVRASREKSSGDIISALYKAVAGFSNGTKQQDDLTAVVIKRR